MKTSLIHINTTPQLRRHWLTKCLALTVFMSAIACGAAFAQESTPSGSISPNVWDDIDQKWEEGNPSGWAEADTAAIAIRLTSLVKGTQYTITFCVQNEDGNDNTWVPFVNFNDWDATSEKVPDFLPGSINCPP